ncbi:MAG: SDR family NAD(P)-dependent oxidoreductase [Candidatus Undinarchaeales archaeon]|jgi:UDP-glucuronate decarboxylase|nr:SDR family NAD(P)-dependent oxidoreductase [Candidatus Undinarchaeales archaeon]
MALHPSIASGVSEILSRLGDAKVSFAGQRVLVTGGAGFLGSWVCDVLVAQGAEVVCLDNLSSGLATHVAHLHERDEFTFIEHDISQPYYPEGGLDCVLHLASRASPMEFDKHPISILKANTLGIWIALGIAKAKDARVMYASTSEVYGDPDPRFVPSPETYNGNVNPVGVRGCYDEAKRCGEAFVIAYVRQHGLNARIARIFNTYGPRIRSEGIYGRALPRFLDQAISGKPITIFGTGEQTRSFTYVVDEVEGLLRLAATDNAKGKVVNIGNTVERSILDLARAVQAASGTEVDLVFEPLPDDDPLRRCPDITKAKQILGWEPTVTLEEGLVPTVAWFRDQSA